MLYIEACAVAIKVSKTYAGPVFVNVTLRKGKRGGHEIDPNGYTWGRRKTDNDSSTIATYLDGKEVKADAPAPTLNVKVQEK